MSNLMDRPVNEAAVALAARLAEVYGRTRWGRRRRIRAAWEEACRQFPAAPPEARLQLAAQETGELYESVAAVVFPQRPGFWFGVLWS